MGGVVPVSGTGPSMRAPALLCLTRFVFHLDSLPCVERMQPHCPARDSDICYAKRRQLCESCVRVSEHPPYLLR